MNLYCTYCGRKLKLIDRGTETYYQCPKYGTFWGFWIYGEKAFAHDAVIKLEKVLGKYDPKTGKKLI